MRNYPFWYEKVSIEMLGQHFRYLFEIGDEVNALEVEIFPEQTYLTIKKVNHAKKEPSLAILVRVSDVGREALLRLDHKYQDSELAISKRRSAKKKLLSQLEFRIPAVEKMFVLEIISLLRDVCECMEMELPSWVAVGYGYDFVKRELPGEFTSKDFFWRVGNSIGKALAKIVGRF